MATLGLSPNDPAPLSWPRRLILKPVPFLARALLFFWGFLWIKKYGTPELDCTKAPVWVCNHVAVVDPFITVCESTSSFVSKKENLGLPVVGSLLLATKSVLVDRDSKAKQNAKEELVKKAQLAAADKNQNRVLIFPEGTTTSGEALISFKPGAFAAGLPVQPICLKYPANYCNLSMNAEPNMWKQLLTMLLQFSNWVEIHYLPVHYPTEEEKNDPYLYAKVVRQKMADAMGIPTTEHSYEDVRLRILAQTWHLKGQTEGVIVNDLRELYHISFDKVQELTRKFAAMDVDNSGTLDEAEFAHLLGLPPSSAIVEELFHLFDKNGDNSLDFKEFIVGLSSMTSEVEEDQEALIRHCFSLFDTNGDETIDMKEFTSIMVTRFPHISKPEITEMFYDIDKNHDHRISYDEFSEFARENPIYTKIAKEMVERREKEEAKIRHEMEKM